VTEATRTAELEAIKAGDPATRNAAQVAAERDGTAALTFLPAVHVSAETAHVIEDYPYGFRLRCTKRVWVERNKRGQRVVEQTSNPKKPGTWNKPKASTYWGVCHLAIRRADGHVIPGGIGPHESDAARLDDCESRMGHVLTDACRAAIRDGRAFGRAMSRVNWTVTSAEPSQMISLSALARGEPEAVAQAAAETARQEARKLEQQRERKMLAALVMNERAAMSSAALPFPSLGTAEAPPGE
jgi:hypothetical protein